MDASALLDVAEVVRLGAFVVVAASWLERALRVSRPVPARDLLVRPGGRHDLTPAEAFQHAEGASAWTR